MDKKAVEEKVANYRYLEQRHQMLMERRDEILPRMIEIGGTVEAIAEMEKVGKSEFLLPLGSGVLVPVEVDPKSKMVMAVGSDVVLEKDLAGIRAELKSRLDMLGKGLQEIEGEIVKVEETLAALEPELRMLLGK